MYLSPALHVKSNTPQEYTNRARDEITKKLNLPTTNLRHGSSSLKIVTNASDTSLSKIASNDSIDSQISNHSNKTAKKLFGFGNKLRNITSQSSLKEQFHNLTRSSSNNSHHQLTIHEERDQEQEQEQEHELINNNSTDIDMSDADSIIIPSLNDMQPLQPMPSINSTASQFTNISYQSSLNNSLFSHQNSLSTQFTNISSPIQYSQQHQLQQPPKLILTLQQALPTNFSDMYAPELLADPSLLIDGRPLFTKRDLLDWNLNDIRSLLIIEQPRIEWGNQIPLIYPSSNHDFKFEFLPLDSNDEIIVETLVNSDIYKEAKFDKNFRIQTAKYTLNTARKRHEFIIRANGASEGYKSTRLSKPEWRNIIENFLLNLAVEAQCRYDYKREIHDIKKQRRNSINNNNDSSSNNNNAPPHLIKSGTSSLLRKAIMNGVSSKNNNNNTIVSTSLTKDEKADVWTNVQSQVYKRLGLDWAPDQIST